jgi:xylan 1,4-beta-xylosidase
LKQTYKNPIIPGFNPDPSICRVGTDYYLVTSTFEYFPGLPIYHSENLVDWQLVSHGINRPSQMQLSAQVPNAFGLYAPTIRYINERFYITCTNVPYEGKNSGNFYIWSDGIEGPWSDPIWLDLPGIDPSLFIDEDGKVYYTGTDQTIYLTEIDLTTGKTGPRVDIWSGTGAADPEGPHLYKKDGYYYLLISEGGTSYGHMLTMARSKTIKGPYAPCPMNPLLTNRSTSLPLQAVGHADLFQDHNKRFWAVCLAVRPIGYPLSHLLGRETCLIPVEWEDDWPKFGENKQLALTYDAFLPGAKKVIEQKATTEANNWVSLYTWDETLLEENKNDIQLTPNAIDLSDGKAMAFAGLRQEQLAFHFEVTLQSFLEEGSTGVTAFLNRKHHYELFIRKNEQLTLVFRRQIGSLWKIEKEIPLDTDELTLMIDGTASNYHFSYQVNDETPILVGEGETKYLTTETGGVFTGIFLGVYGVNLREDQKKVIVKHITYQNH